MDDGPDGNGIDNDALSLSLTSSNNDSVLYAASHPRYRGLDIEDAAYTQRAAISNSDGGDGANLFIHDRTLATAGTDSADHTASGDTSWEERGASTSTPTSGSTPRAPPTNSASMKRIPGASTLHGAKKFGATSSTPRRSTVS